MNNKLTKPISSPRRTTEKFPPPLMRFLRSNVGSKSRRRSRASPNLFLKKKNTLIEEPTSPKVTCIGQVRVRRRSNKPTTTTTTTSHNRRNRLCRCLNNLKTVWNKCVTFFCCGGCKTTQLSPVANNLVTGEKCNRLHEQQQVHEQLYQENENVTLGKADNNNINEGLMLRSQPTPKSAFLLTRCRSAPYRSSSLASIFKETPIIMEKTEEEEEVKNLEIKKEDESNVCEESKAAAVPLILSRCKSEPATRWDQLLLN